MLTNLERLLNTAQKAPKMVADDLTKRLTKIGARSAGVTIPSMWLYPLMGKFLDLNNLRATDMPFIRIQQTPDGSILITRADNPKAREYHKLLELHTKTTAPAPPQMAVPRTNASVWTYAQTPEELPPVMLDRYTKFVKSLPVHSLKRDDKTDISHTWVMAYNEGLPKSKPERDELLTSAEQMLRDCYTLDDFDI